MALANGGDELVLLDGGLVEVDRVEWDGGPAFPDPTGASMALKSPALDNNVGANWCEATTPYGAGDLGTPGAANDCAVPVPELVINEVMQNPAAVFDSDGEWFEIHNPTAGAIDIDGWTVKDNDIDSFVIANGGPLLVPAGGYVVLGNNADSGTNGGVTVDYEYSGMFLSNGADELVLLDGGLNEVDRVEWDGGPAFPDPTGASMALKDPALDNNVGANWCTASTPFGAGDLGTPGGMNDCPIVVPDFLINEIMQNPAAVFDSNGEWFELHNTTDSDVDINGWTIADNDFDSHVIANGGPLLLPAGGYLVLGRNADYFSNGGVNVDYQYDDFFLSNSSDEVVLLDGAGIEVDRVEYDNGATFPDPTGASMSLLDPALDNNVGANWCEAVTPYGFGDRGTPGGQNTCVPVIPPFGACGDDAVFIWHIQGDGPASAWDGTEGVIIEGVVVGDFQGSDELRGIFVQEEDSDADGNPETSDGIFVFLGGTGPDVAPGDVVRVQGTVDEFFELTEITGVINMVDCGYDDTATPAAITLPQASLDDWERNEGMAVTFAQTLVASDHFNQARFGEVELALETPLDAPTNVVAPGAPANALQDLNDRSRIQLEDGSRVQNPLPLPPYLGDDNTLRIGDSLPGLAGVLSFSFGAYEVHPTFEVVFTRENPRPEEAPNVGGSLLTVAGFNVLNYFTTLDGSGAICGPLGDQGCRGADNPFEFERQKAKIVDALVRLDADIAGVIELENAPDDTPLADLVDGLNAVVGAGAFDYIATGAIGPDAIRQGIIYRPETLTPVGGFGILDDSFDPDYRAGFNRPALAQTFEENTSGERFTVVVNHLKSKGSDCEDVGDFDAGDGQGNCNGVRTDAAMVLVDWLASDPTGSGDPDFLIIGDLNAYAMEDPVMVIESGGYTDLIKAFVGTGFVDGAYSFNFRGQSGYLDHALTSPSLLGEVSGAASWHINADEPRGLDYNDFNQPGLFNPDAFRSSDHDVIVAGILLDADEDGVWDGIDQCPGTVIPESVPTLELGVNRFALTNGDGIFDTVDPRGNGPRATFSIHDTAGCSCEQIIEAQELGDGHVKFGCSLGEMEEWVELVGLP
ncbi:MAG: ExeM/NucH family extracellular endonuclease, partial [Xanthomonadales bacterium]|nr:ExeM/NucH family extracellular endonuclease [Xanthomonadales bacterium]